jgi:hypothetical protein
MNFIDIFSPDFGVRYEVVLAVQPLFSALEVVEGNPLSPLRRKAVQKVVCAA